MLIGMNYPSEKTVLGEDALSATHSYFLDCIDQ